MVGRAPTPVLNRGHADTEPSLDSFAFFDLPAGQAGPGGNPSARSVDPKRQRAVSELDIHRTTRTPCRCGRRNRVGPHRQIRRRSQPPTPELVDCDPPGVQPQASFAPRHSSRAPWRFGRDLRSCTHTRCPTLEPPRCRSSLGLVNGTHVLLILFSTYRQTWTPAIVAPPHRAAGRPRSPSGEIRPPYRYGSLDALDFRMSVIT